MADYATHYWDGSWKTTWHVDEEKARENARTLINEGTTDEVFISVEIARAYPDDVVFEDIE